MLKVILDTNVLLSALMFGGMAEKVLDAIVDNKLQLFVSQDLKNESIRKFREYGAKEQILQKLAIFLDYKSFAVVPKVSVNVCRDPEDNYLLELAETCQADYLITRDKDLLELKGNVWKDTRIIKPEDFLALLRKLGS